MKQEGRFKVGDIVEQVNLGDLPFLVREVDETTDTAYGRYKLEGIDGSKYENVPDYCLTRARPPEQSRYGGRSQTG